MSENIDYEKLAEVCAKTWIDRIIGSSYSERLQFRCDLLNGITKPFAEQARGFSDDLIIELGERFEEVLRELLGIETLAERRYKLYKEKKEREKLFDDNKRK